MILDLLPRRKETRATLKDADGWFHEWALGGRRSTSGEVVGPRSALSLSGYYAALRNISEDVAKMPFHVIRRPKRSGKREKLYDHPAFRLMNVAPNPEMDALAFRETLLHHALGWGNGYAEIVRNGAGVPVELWPLDPALVTVDYDDSNRLRYKIRGKNAVSDVILRSDQVFHVHGLSYGGVDGYSVAQLARETIGLGISEIKAGGSVFGNSMRPSGILTVQGKLTKEAQIALREGWETNYQGNDKIGKLAIVHSGATYTPISINPDDAQWIEGRQMTVEDLCRWLRINPSKVQHLLKSNYNTLEMSNMEHVQDTLLPWMIRFEQQANRKLLSPREADVYTKHNADSMLRADTKTRFEAHAIGRQWGWYSANDVLEIEDKDGIGEQGDVYMIPANMMDASKINEEPEPVVMPQSPPPDEPEDDNARKLLRARMLIDSAQSGRTEADTIESIVWSQSQSLADVFIRVADRLAANKGKAGRDRHIELASSWIGSLAAGCAGTTWAVLRSSPRPEAVDKAIYAWSNDSATRLVDTVSSCNGDAPVVVDEMVASELGRLGGFLRSLYAIDEEN